MHYVVGCHCDATGTQKRSLSNGSTIYAYCPQRKCSCKSGFSGSQCQCGDGQYDKNGQCEGISQIALKTAIFKLLNGIRTYNHVVCKRTLNHLGKCFDNHYLNGLAK